MIRDKTSKLGLIAVALAISACSSGGNVDSEEVDDTQLLLEDTINIDSVTTPEVTTSNETSEGIATPVVTISAADMDAYLSNPLVKANPASIRGSANTGLSSNFIINPLSY